MNFDPFTDRRPQRTQQERQPQVELSPEFVQAETQREQLYRGAGIDFDRDADGRVFPKESERNRRLGIQPMAPREDGRIDIEQRRGIDQIATQVPQTEALLKQSRERRRVAQDIERGKRSELQLFDNQFGVQRQTEEVWNPETRSLDRVPRITFGVEVDEETQSALLQTREFLEEEHRRASLVINQIDAEVGRAQMERESWMQQVQSGLMAPQQKESEVEEDGSLPPPVGSDEWYQRIEDHGGVQRTPETKAYDGETVASAKDALPAPEGYVRSVEGTDEGIRITDRKIEGFEESRQAQPESAQGKPGQQSRPDRFLQPGAKAPRNTKELREQVDAFRELESELIGFVESLEKRTDLSESERRAFGESIIRRAGQVEAFAKRLNDAQVDLAMELQEESEQMASDYSKAQMRGQMVLREREARNALEVLDSGASEAEIIKAAQGIGLDYSDAEGRLSDSQLRQIRSRANRRIRDAEKKLAKFDERFLTDGIKALTEVAVEDESARARMSKEGLPFVKTSMGVELHPMSFKPEWRRERHEKYLWHKGHKIPSWEEAAQQAVKAGDMTKDELEMMRPHWAAEALRQQELDDRSIFSIGKDSFLSAVHGTIGSAHSTASAVARRFGREGAAQRFEERYKNRLSRAAEYSDSMLHIDDVQGPRDLVRAAMSAGAMASVSISTIMAGTYTGGKVGSMILPGKGTIAGSIIGGFTAGHALYFGDAYATLLEQGVDEKDAFRIANMSAAPASAVSLYWPMAWQGLMMRAGGQALYKRTAAEAAKDYAKRLAVYGGGGSLLEGSAEGMAETFLIMGEQSAGIVISEEEAWSRRRNAAFAGSVFGGGMGVAPAVKLSGRMDTNAATALLQEQFKMAEMRRPILEDAFVKRLEKMAEQGPLSKDQQKMLDYLKALPEMTKEEADAARELAPIDLESAKVMEWSKEDQALEIAKLMQKGMDVGATKKDLTESEANRLMVLFANNPGIMMEYHIRAHKINKEAGNRARKKAGDLEGDALEDKIRSLMPEMRSEVIADKGFIAGLDKSVQDSIKGSEETQAREEREYQKIINSEIIRDPALSQTQEEAEEMGPEMDPMTFVFKAKDTDGNEVVIRVESRSLGSATEVLKERGLTDIVATGQMASDVSPAPVARDVDKSKAHGKTLSEFIEARSPKNEKARANLTKAHRTAVLRAIENGDAIPESTGHADVDAATQVAREIGFDGRATRMIADVLAIANDARGESGPMKVEIVNSEHKIWTRGPRQGAVSSDGSTLYLNRDLMDADESGLSVVVHEAGHAVGLTMSDFIVGEWQGLTAEQRRGAAADYGGEMAELSDSELSASEVAAQEWFSFQFFRVLKSETTVENIQKSYGKRVADRIRDMVERFRKVITALIGDKSLSTEALDKRISEIVGDYVAGQSVTQEQSTQKQNELSQEKTKEQQEAEQGQEGAVGAEALLTVERITSAGLKATEQDVSVADIDVNKDIIQFKADADPVTGVVEGEALQGDFDVVKAGRILVMEKIDGTMEIITGRHRLDLAKRSGAKTIPAFVFRESEGFTFTDAMMIDAEFNIADGQGKVKDYANYFKTVGEGITKAQAIQRGLLSRIQGRQGWALGREAVQGLFDLYANNQIKENRAVAIAEGAPNNEAAQMLAARKAKTMTAEQLRYYTEMLAQMDGIKADSGAEQMGFEDILGAESFAEIEAEAEAFSKAQSEMVSEAADYVRVAKNASRNPQAAEKMGIDVKDPEGTRQKVAEMEARVDALKNPRANPTVENEIRKRAGLPEKTGKAEAQQEEPAIPETQDDPNQQDMFGEPDADAEPAPDPKAQPPKKPKLTAEEKEIGDALEGLFSPEKANQAIVQKAIPFDTLMRLRPTVEKLIAQGKSTPKDVVETLDRIAEAQGKPKGARVLSRSLYSVFIGVDPSLPDVSDWSAVFAEVDAESGAATDGKSVARIVSERLAAGESLSRTDLNRFAEESGLTAKEVDEWVEVGVTQAARSIVEQSRASGESDAQIYDKLVDLYDRQPNLTAKTSTSKIEQAYSTPVPFAFVASRLAKIDANKVVFEPTAGHGALLLESNPSKTYANELNDGRRSRLESMEIAADVDSSDATEQVVPDQYADVVIGNPPFGAIKNPDGSTVVWAMPDGGQTSSIDFQIVMQSLKAMKDNGRAVFLIGGLNKILGSSPENRQEAYSKGQRGDFLKALYDNYNVIDYFTVSGDLYRKMGAGWPIDVIVVSGKGKARTALPSEKNPRILESWEALKNEVNKSDSQRFRERQQTQEDIQGVVDGVIDGIRGGGSGAVGQRPGTKASSSRDRDSDGQKPRGSSSDGKGSGRPIRDVPDVLPSDGQVGTDSVRGQGGSSDVGVGRPAKPVVKAESQGDYLDKYVPGSKNAGFDTLIPKNISSAVRNALDKVEQKTGQTVDAYVTQKLGYKNEAEMMKHFAAEQIDALALAIYQSETGAALVVGDQTGIGKGRVAAGMIRYSINNGKVPIFVTAKPGLYSAMLEDLSDIGSADIVPIFTNNGETIKDPLGRVWKSGNMVPKVRKIKLTGELPKGADVLFTTYDQMRDVESGLTKKDKAKFKRKNEAPPDGDRSAAIRSLIKKNKAVLVLDEAHKASGQSIAGFRMMNFVKEADSVLYLSATFAKRPDSMPVYMRTHIGLVGDGKPQTIIDAMSKGGVPLQQAVSIMLTESGQYVRRERDFKGVIYKTHVNTNTAERDTKIADAYIGGLRQIYAASINVKNAVENINKIIKDKAGSMSAKSTPKLESDNFAAKIHNMVSQYLLAIKAKSASDLAIEAVQEGVVAADGKKKRHKVIITVQNTMASPIKQLFESGEEISFNGLLRNYLNQQRRIKTGKGEDASEIFISPEPMPGFESISDRQLTDMLVVREPTPDNPNAARIDGDAAKELLRRVINAELVKVEQELSKIDLGDMPISPIDSMRRDIEAMGIKTGEITGRDFIIDSEGKMQMRNKSETGTDGQLATLDLFNNSDVDVMIINASGSTGISAHASEKFKRQDPRMMIVAQANADINEFMQTLGRIHRSGQVEMPYYTTLQTAIPAELRPAALLGKKMASLNANTTSNAKSEVSESSDVRFDFDKYSDEVIHKILLGDPGLVDMLGYGSDLLDDAGRVIPLEAAKEKLKAEDDGDFGRKITGRMAIALVEEQTEFWSKAETDYANMISYLNEIGQNDLIAEELDIKAETIEQRPFTTGGATDSVFDGPSFIEKVRVEMGEKPPSGIEVMKMAEKVRSEKREEVRKANELLSKAYDDARNEAKAKENWADRQANWERSHLEKRQAVAQSLDYVGRLVQIGESSYGAVVDFKIDPAHILAPSKSFLTIRANTGKGTIRMPMSMVAENLKPAFQGGFDQIYDATMDWSSERMIITGNLLAAYAELSSSGSRSGKIITYTTSEGEIKTGIMLTAAALKDIEASRSARVELKTAEEAAAALQSRANAIQNDSETVSIRVENGKYKIYVPASKRFGGKFWQNKNINAALVGGEFAQAKNEMEGEIRPERLVDVLREIKDSGEQLFFKSKQRADRGEPLYSPQVKSQHADQKTRERKGELTDGEKMQPMVGRDVFPSEGGATLFAPAWHGSPHRFDRFSLDRIGTGEGAQAYGYGLYFAQRQGVGEYYREVLGSKNRTKVRWEWKQQKRFAEVDKVLSEDFGWNTKEELIQGLRERADAVENEFGDPDPNNDYNLAADLIESGAIEITPADQGHLYRVELAIDDADLLDWDKPLSEQSEKVREAVRSLYPYRAESRDGGEYWVLVDKDGNRANSNAYASEREAMDDAASDRTLGREIYADLSGSIASGLQKEASEALLKAGIPGIRYLDGMSRRDGEGSYNYVIFDESKIIITEINGAPVDLQEAAKMSEEAQGWAGDTLFAPELLESQVGIQSRRWNMLQRKKERGTLNIEEVAEMELIEKELGQEFLPFWEADNLPMNASEQDKINALKLRAQHEARLRGDDIASQQDLFEGGLFDEKGQGMLFSPPRVEIKPDVVEIINERTTTAEDPRSMMRKVFEKGQKDRLIETRRRSVAGTADNLVYFKYGVDDSLGSGLGTSLDATLNPWKSAHHTRDVRRMHEGWMINGAYQYKNGDITPIRGSRGFIPILFDVFKHGRNKKESNYLVSLAESYLAALRGRELLKEGRERNFGFDRNGYHAALGRGEDVTINDFWSQERAEQEIDKIISEAEQYDFIPQFQKEYAQWNKHLLDYMEDSGYINKEQRAQWESDVYVPLNRVMDAAEEAKRILGPKASTDPRKVAKLVRRLKGGTGKVAILENISNNLSVMLQEAIINQTKQKMVLTMGHNGDLMERMPYKAVPLNTTREELIRVLAAQHYNDLKAEGAIPSGLTRAQFITKAVKDAADGVYENLGIQTEAQLETRLQIWRMKRPEGENIMTVMVKGKPQFWKIHDSGTMSSVMALGPDIWQSSAATWLKPFNMAKRFITEAITLSPSFVTANAIRETLWTWTASEQLALPGISMATGTAEMWGKEGLDVDLAGLGLGQGADWGGYRNDPTMPKNARKAIMSMTESQRKDFSKSVINSPKKAWRLYQHVVETAEYANRYGLAKEVIARGGSHSEAAFQGKFLTNFSSHGGSDIVRALVYISPFLNSRIQGLYRISHAAGGVSKADTNRARALFTMKAGIIVSATIGLMRINWDNPEYEELSQWDKDAYWHVFLGGQHFRIPKPFEVGAVFGTLPELMVEGFLGKIRNKDARDALWRMLTQTFAVDFRPQGILQIDELQKNKASFTGRPIESFGDQFLAPQDRYGVHTPETFKQIANAMPENLPKSLEFLQSPKQLEHVWRGLTGTLGTYTIDMADIMVRRAVDAPDPAANHWRDAPILRDVVGRFWRSPEPRTSKYVGQFYELYRETEDAMRQINRARERGEEARIDRIVDRSGDQLQAMPELKRINTQLSAISARTREIRYDPFMSREDKREELRELTKQRNELARRGVSIGLPPPS